MNVIQTTYNGVTYRSRTEARWAVVFDHLGWTHFYEIEAFKLGNIIYLPDFYLPDFRAFFEVKGKEPSRYERWKAELLCLESRCDVMISTGPPNPNRKEWDEDIISYIYEEIEDEPFADIHSGGFVSRRRDNHPACSLHQGNLGYLGSKIEIGWENAFRAAANNRFGIHD